MGQPQALSFALFRTYAVPSIGRLLDDTGEFTSRVQKRYDDTGLLLEEVQRHGFGSDRGRSAVRRINQMHAMYDISNDDMRYVLATFVVVPKRWMDDYGFRRLSPNEVVATTNYYIELGRRMAIKDMPDDFAGFERLLDDYEREHFAFDAGGRRVADSTLDLMTTFPPNNYAPKWVVRRFALLADGRAVAARVPLPDPDTLRAGAVQRRDAAACPAAAAVPCSLEAQVGQHLRLLPHLPGGLRDRQARHVPGRHLPRPQADAGVR